MIKFFEVGQVKFFAAEDGANNGGKGIFGGAVIVVEEQAAAFEFRPVGYGMQDFPGILKACEKAGAQWLVVEQDSPSMGKSPLECAEMSIRYLAPIL